MEVKLEYEFNKARHTYYPDMGKVNDFVEQEFAKDYGLHIATARNIIDDYYLYEELYENMEDRIKEAFLEEAYQDFLDRDDD